MNKDVENVLKVLGDPIMLDFTENVRRIRTNLLIVSTIALGIIWGGVTINPDSTLFGIQFNGMSNDLIMKFLLAMNVYMLAHFAWCSWDSVLEWFLKVTGTRTAFITGAKFGAEEADYPSDPRQSTLYNWWKVEATRIGSIGEYVTNTDALLEQWQEKVKIALKGDPNVHSSIAFITQAREALNKISHSLENTKKTIESNRIPASLHRFDICFQLMLRSQNLRWLILELGFPFVFGCFTVYLLSKSIA